MLTEAQRKALKRVSQIEKIAKDPHGQLDGTKLAFEKPGGRDITNIFICQQKMETSI